MTKRPLNPIDVLLICALKDEYDQVLQVTDGLVNPWQEYSLDNGWMVADASFSTCLTNKELCIRATYASYMGREQAQAVAGNLINEQLAAMMAKN